jgi:transcription-repair coupling factor (superfamily II helicase)
MFYKRFSLVANPDQLADLRAELADRFGELPDEVDNLSELMLVKAEMRDLRLRGMESGPGRLVLTLGADAALDARKLALLLQHAKGTYRLTPDMKLIARIPEGLKGHNLLQEAKKLLQELNRTRSS